MPAADAELTWVPWCVVGRGGGGGVHGTAAAGGDPQVRAGAVPAEGQAAGGGAAGGEGQLQHAGLLGALRARPPGRHRLLQLPEGAS